MNVSGISKEGQAGGGSRLCTETGGKRMTAVTISGTLTVYQARSF